MNYVKYNRSTVKFRKPDVRNQDELGLYCTENNEIYVCSFSYIKTKTDTRERCCLLAEKRFNRPHNYKSRRSNLTFIHTIYVSNLNFTDCFGSKDVTVIY